MPQRRVLQPEGFGCSHRTRSLGWPGSPWRFCWQQSHKMHQDSILLLGCFVLFFSPNVLIEEKIKLQFPPALGEPVVLWGERQGGAEGDSGGTGAQISIPVTCPASWDAQSAFKMCVASAWDHCPTPPNLCKNPDSRSQPQR